MANQQYFFYNITLELVHNVIINQVDCQQPRVIRKRPIIRLIQLIPLHGRLSVSDRYGVLRRRVG